MEARVVHVVWGESIGGESRSRGCGDLPSTGRTLALGGKATGGLLEG